MRLTLTQRLSLVFAVLLLVCCGTSAWMQVRSNQMHELEVVQGLSRDLAQHIAHDTVLMDRNGPMANAVRELFSRGTGVLGQQARQHVERHYAWDTVVDSLLSHYHAVLGDSVPRVANG